jgi:small-conductance mechanosensitive channel
MKLDVKAVVIAEAIVGAALFILCRLAFVVAPDATLATLKNLTHIDWSSVTMPVSLGGFISGLVVFTIFMAVVGGIWAWIYNFIARSPSAAS